MRLESVWHAITARVRVEHRSLPSFHAALRAAGGQAGAVDRGHNSVPVDRIIGSVGRSQNLRSDFFYRTGQAMTQRFHRIGHAMRAGIQLPPIEVYKLKVGSNEGAQGRSEYYVLDGHHRVAMARKLGQDFIDAHIVEYHTRDARLAHMLRSVDMLRDAPAADLAELWKRLSEMRFPAGAVICRRYDRGDCLYIIKSGSVEVRLGTGADGASLYRLEAGDCFGEMALLTGQSRSADVVALDETFVWKLDRPDFDAVVNQSVPLLRALNRSMAHRLSMATRVIEQTRYSNFEPGPSRTSLRIVPRGRTTWLRWDVRRVLCRARRRRHDGRVEGTTRCLGRSERVASSFETRSGTAARTSASQCNPIGGGWSGI